MRLQVVEPLLGASLPQWREESRAVSGKLGSHQTWALCHPVCNAQRLINDLPAFLQSKEDSKREKGVRGSLFEVNMLVNPKEC